MDNNNQLYTYNREFLTHISDRAISMAGKVYGVVAESVESLQQIFNTTQVPLNPEMVRFEALTQSEEGDIALICEWDLSKELVKLTVVRMVDNVVLGGAQLRLTDNNFSESYGRFRDGELKSKVRTWFDSLSQTNPDEVKEVGNFYESRAAQANVQSEAPAPEAAAVPTVEPEIVSEG